MQRNSRSLFLSSLLSSSPLSQAPRRTAVLLTLGILRVLAGITLSAEFAQASPIPGAASSAVVQPGLGIVRSPLGFELQSGGSGWSPAEVPTDNKFIAAVFKPSQKNSKASLTVRVDRLSRDVALNTYIQRWQKEYPKYGFDVLGSKPFAQNNLQGYVLDLLNRDNKQEMRQVVFMKSKKAVILTCKDQDMNFRNSLKDCNQIIRAFQWARE